MDLMKIKVVCFVFMFLFVSSLSAGQNAFLSASSDSSDGTETPISQAFENPFPSSFLQFINELSSDNRLIKNDACSSEITLIPTNPEIEPDCEYYYCCYPHYVSETIAEPSIPPKVSINLLNEWDWRNAEFNGTHGD